MNASPEDRITALIERLGRLLDAEANASELHPVQWEVLRYLARANRFSRSSAALTAYLGSTKGTVSQTVASLRKKGFVRNRTDLRDRRRNRLSLTAKGRRMLAHDPLAAMAGAVARLPGPTRSDLVHGLERLLSASLHARGRRPFGQCRACVHFARRHPAGAPHYCTLLGEELSVAESLKICHEQKTG